MLQAAENAEKALVKMKSYKILLNLDFLYVCFAFIIWGGGYFVLMDAYVHT